LEKARRSGHIEPAFDFEGGLETAILGGKVVWLGTAHHTYGVPKEKFVQALRQNDLPGNTIYNFSVDSVKEANELMKEVREYRTDK